MTRHQGNFEIWERHLFRIGVVGFLLLIAICSFVGWYLGRKLLSPLGQLTKEAVRAEGLIQNGKIIGAVTHVMVNDPTMGYGISIEAMLNAAETANTVYAAKAA